MGPGRAGKAWAGLTRDTADTRWFACGRCAGRGAHHPATCGTGQCTNQAHGSCQMMNCAMRGERNGCANNNRVRLGYGNKISATSNNKHNFIVRLLLA